MSNPEEHKTSLGLRAQFKRLPRWARVALAVAIIIAVAWQARQVVFKSQYALPDGLWRGDPVRPVFGPHLFVNHEKPRPQEPPLYAEWGCAPGDDVGLVTCAKDSPITALGCQLIAAPPDVAAFLSNKAEPVVSCALVALNESNEEAGFGHIMCSGGVGWSYVFEVDGEMIVADSLADMQALFAPIETPEEALAYASLVADEHARFEFPLAAPNIVYYERVIEDSYARPEGDNFRVLLHKTNYCGCGTSDDTFQVEIIVSPDGALTYDQRNLVYAGMRRPGCYD